MNIDENNFVEQIKEKNSKALEFAVDKYSNLVFKVVRTVLNSKFQLQHSEECVNDVFWAVWNNIWSFDPEKGKFKYWITAIAKYKAIDYKRKLFNESTNDSVDNYDFQCDINTEHTIISKENRKEILRAINDMKDLDKQIFIRRYFLCENIENIAESYGLNRRINRKRNFKFLKCASIAAAISLISITGIGMVSPAFAENIPILNSIIQTLNDRLGSHGNYSKYSQLINKSVTSNGVTLTINEAMADGSKLIIGYTVKSNKKIEGLESSSLSRFLKINGKYIDGSTGSASGNYINSCTYVGTEEIHTDLFKNSSNFNVDLNIDELSNIRGKWNFEFSISKDELVKNSRIFKPDKKIDLPDSTANIDKIVFSPIDTSIFVSGNVKTKKYISDSSNNSYNNVFNYNYWIVFDDNGVQLLPKGGGITGDFPGTFSTEMNYMSVKRIPKYLTVIPCNIYSTGAGGTYTDKNSKKVSYKMKGNKPEEIYRVIDGKYPIEFPQGRMGKLIINEIKTESNSTTIRFTAVGKAPYFQATNLFVKDNSGKDLAPKRYIDRLDDKHPNEFTIVFPALDSNKKYTLKTTDLSNFEFREDLKFRIDLNE